MSGLRLLPLEWGRDELNYINRYTKASDRFIDPQSPASDHPSK